MSVNAVGDDGLLPSEFTILVNHALEAEPGVDRKSVTTPLIARLRTEGLAQTERFMKGEVHFLHLQPEESRDEYWEFRNFDDDFGRVARFRAISSKFSRIQGSAGNPALESRSDDGLWMEPREPSMLNITRLLARIIHEHFA